MTKKFSFCVAFLFAAVFNISNVVKADDGRPKTSFGVIKGELEQVNSARSEYYQKQSFRHLSVNANLAPDEMFADLYVSHMQMAFADWSVPVQSHSLLFASEIDLIGYAERRKVVIVFPRTGPGDIEFGDNAVTGFVMKMSLSGRLDQQYGLYVNQIGAVKSAATW